MRLGAQEIQPMEFIPTGSLAVDSAIGIGGFPRGRVVEVFGPESSGKTTLALSVIGQAQKRGGVAAFIDAEHALDAEYAKKLGVDIDNLLVSQPDNGEQALEIAEMLVRSNAVDIIVIDSVAALTPKAELEGEMGDSHVGLQARLMSQALRKLTAIVAKSNTCMVFINQIREKIGVMFGSPETTTGGRALKFYSSIRVDIRRISAIKEGEVVTGSRAKVKIVKNKVAAPSARPNSTSTMARASPAPASSSTWASSRSWCRKAVPGSTTGISGSARGARTRSSFCATIRSSPTSSRGSCARRSACPPAPTSIRLRPRRPSPGDSRRPARARLAAAGAAVAVALAGCGRAASSGSERLALEAPRWWFSRLPVRIEAVPRGILVGREASLTVALDSNVAGRWKMAGKPTTIWVPGAQLSAGSHRIVVKTGSERSEADIQVISVIWLATPLAIAAALVAALISRWRRGRQAS
jgi:protein RecA